MPYKDPQKERERKKKKYLENVEQNRERSRKYYAEHKEQHKIVQRRWYEKNKDRVQAYQKLWATQNRDRATIYLRRYRQKIKAAALSAYGTCCACCGEDNIEFLTLDHKNNDGKQHREITGKVVMYTWLVKNNFPKEWDLQVLCYNCNLGRAKRSGICPHKSNKVTLDDVTKKIGV